MAKPDFDLKDYAQKVFSGGFKSSTQRLLAEELERNKGTAKVKPFGIKFLDDAMGGIEQNDLIVFGARSGVGKTEMLTHVAQSVSNDGGRVHYFALEAETHEIERRVRYKHIANLYFADPDRKRGITVKYRYWRNGSLSFYLEPYEKASRQMAEASMKNIFTYYKDETDSEFTIDTFEEKLGKIRGQTDFIIIDHLNYFDKRTEGSSDEVFRIMKTIRAHALRLNVPVLMASQVRKKDKRDTNLIPDMEDIFGSSDVYKIATKVIMFAPNDARASNGNRTFETFMRCQKMRTDSSVARFIGITQFDSGENKYLPEYKVAHSYKFDQNSMHLTGMELPDWAQSFVKSYEPEFGNSNRAYKDD